MLKVVPQAVAQISLKNAARKAVQVKKSWNTVNNGPEHLKE